jgi:hypothetical protein
MGYNYYGTRMEFEERMKDGGKNKFCKQNVTFNLFKLHNLHSFQSTKLKTKSVYKKIFI